MSINIFVRDVMDAYFTKSNKAAMFFEEVSRMASDSNLSLEFQELGKVLQEILGGIKNPDLSKLPKVLADLVTSELEK